MDWLFQPSKCHDLEKWGVYVITVMAVCHVFSECCVCGWLNLCGLAVQVGHISRVSPYVYTRCERPDRLALCDWRAASCNLSWTTNLQPHLSGFLTSQQTSTLVTSPSISARVLKCLISCGPVSNRSRSGWPCVLLHPSQGVWFAWFITLVHLIYSDPVIVCHDPQHRLASLYINIFPASLSQRTPSTAFQALPNISSPRRWFS